MIVMEEHHQGGTAIKHEPRQNNSPIEAGDDSTSAPHTDASSKADHGPLARYVKLRVAHAPGMPGTFSPPPRVIDPDMHHGTCVTHVP